MVHCVLCEFHIPLNTEERVKESVVEGMPTTHDAMHGACREVWAGLQGHRSEGEHPDRAAVVGRS